MGLQRQRRRSFVNFVTIVGKPFFLAVAVHFQNSNVPLILAVSALWSFCSFASNNWTGNCTNCQRALLSAANVSFCRGVVGSGGVGGGRRLL